MQNTEIRLQHQSNTSLNGCEVLARHYEAVVVEHRRLLRERGTEPDNNAQVATFFRLLVAWQQGYNLPKPYSNHKGWLLRGGMGVGKTKAVEAFAFATNESVITDRDFAIRFAHIFDIQTAYIQQNEDYINRLKTAQTLVIDDIGIEPTDVQYFGNRLSPFIDLFDKRYRSNRKTIITTNLLPQELREKYGERIFDRMRESLNDYVLTGKSYRQ